MAASDGPVVLVFMVVFVVVAVSGVGLVVAVGSVAATEAVVMPGGAAQRAERPRDPGGVAAFMSAHSKTPYITPSMEFSSGEGVVRGRRMQQLTFT